MKLFSDIELLICDVDGVLTDGSIIISDLHHEIKSFHVQDGFAIQLLSRLSLPLHFAVITGRDTPAVLERMQKLGVQHYYAGYHKKKAAFDDLRQKLNIDPKRIAFIGDDWPDLCILQQVGLPIAVPNAVSEVKAMAKFTTQKEGGKGAVHEVIMQILKAKGLYDKALQEYMA